MPDADRSKDRIAPIAIGVGLIGLGVGIYSIASYFSKKKLIDEYVEEARVYRDALMRAYQDGKVDENEQAFLKNLQDSLARKEKAIEAAGLGHELVRVLNAVFGIVIAYAAYKITSRLIEYWIRKYRPPEWKDPKTGEDVGSEEELRRRLESYDSPDPNKYDALVDALAATPDWFKAMVADGLGWTYAQVKNIEAWWNSLSPEQKVAIGAMIAVVVLIIAALAGWFSFIPQIANVFSKALATIM